MNHDSQCPFQSISDLVVNVPFDLLSFSSSSVSIFNLFTFFYWFSHTFRCEDSFPDYFFHLLEDFVQKNLRRNKTPVMFVFEEQNKFFIFSSALHLDIRKLMGSPQLLLVYGIHKRCRKISSQAINLVTSRWTNE